MFRYFIVPALAATLGFVAAPKAVAAPWVEIGASGWNTQLAGNAHSTSGEVNSSIDIRNDLGMGRNWNPNFHLTLFTPGGFIPNLRLEYGRITGNGSNSAHGIIVYNGVIYTADSNILSQVALKQARVLLYWSPLDNDYVNLRVGLDMRWLNANLALSGTAVTVDPNGQQTHQASTSAGAVAWVPLLNLGLTAHLPAHFDFDVEGSYVAYQSSYLYDFRLGFNYRFGFGLTLSLGYRRFRLKVDNDRFSLNGDLDFKGPYGGIAWRF